MRLAEFAGYLASFLVFLTFYMKTIIPLRVIGLCSNCAFIAYGYLDSLYPVLALHLILLPLNGWRLSEMLRLVRQVRAAERSDLNMVWVKPFTSTRRFDSGDVVFRKGDVADSMFFVVSGRYRVAELGIDISAGDVVGELGWLVPERSRTQTLACVQTGEMLQMSYEQVKQLYYQNPQFGFYLLQLVSHRLFDNNARLERELAACKAAGQR